MIRFVTDNLYRGPRPADFQQLAALKISIVIDLESGWYDDLHPGAREAYDAAATAAGIGVFRFRLSDFTAPDPEIVRAALGKIWSGLHCGHRLYVHCLHGVDRTGYVIAAYRMVWMGWTFAEAVAEMLSLGFHRVPYEFWIESLKQFRSPSERTCSP